MQGSRVKQTIQEVLEPTDVRVNGQRPWDIRVHNPDFYHSVLTGGSLALGESYMDGWWDCDALDQFFTRILENKLDKKAGIAFRDVFKALFINAQKKAKSFIVGKKHYDIGNDLFSLMLDKGMNYSCAYWDRAQSLDEAQQAKLDLICRKIGLRSGMKMLDIGCGWGGLARFAAEKYGAVVHGITVSREQVVFANRHCPHPNVRIELLDYRKLTGRFDRIVSIGMFEHVGYKNYRTFIKVVRRCLKTHGVFLLHTIGRNTSGKYADPWINKYIFPNSMLPSARQITSAAEGLLMLEDWHSFGQYYDQTLMAWHGNFIRNWNRLEYHYDQRFFRMWTYYLLMSAGAFRSRRNHLWQIVFSRGGLKSVYRGDAQYAVRGSGSFI